MDRENVSPTQQQQQQNGFSIGNDDSDSQQPIVKKALKGFVGFANLPNQVHRKSVKKGFYFTMMVVGESGLGKSTLVNTLFNANMYPQKEQQELSAETPKTVNIQAVSATLTEASVNLTLTVIDTPGYGDYMNNDQCWVPIVQNIEQRFDSYLEQEMRVNRKKIVDNRVHACLYFIAPSGHSLKPLDIECMKALHQRVNLIPVIAKSDIMNDEELSQFKQSIMDGINENGIQIYTPTVGPYDDAETQAEVKDLVSRIPFAVVGSTKEIDVNGKKVRGRQYPWGVVEVDNEKHNDFVKLRQMLIRSHMEEMKEVTSSVLYEQYRTQKLSQTGSNGTFNAQGQVNPMLKFEEERAAHEAKIAKLEAEMKQVFEAKVAEKEAKMRANEEELYTKHRESREAIERKRAELEEKKRRLEAGRGAAAIGNSTTQDSGGKIKLKKTGIFGK
ncbi:hypothetical protein MP228_009966 [Amoeboaphelidium protococcarum]|nr:hypothetical protein MP228_009966 [Amoeboaphelidium protococcarum]